MRAAAAGYAAASAAGAAAVMLLSPLLMQGSECSKLAKATFRPDKNESNQNDRGGISRRDDRD